MAHPVGDPPGRHGRRVRGPGGPHPVAVGLLSCRGRSRPARLAESVPVLHLCRRHQRPGGGTRRPGSPHGGGGSADRRGRRLADPRLHRPLGGRAPRTQRSVLTEANGTWFIWVVAAPSVAAGAATLEPHFEAERDTL